MLPVPVLFDIFMSGGSSCQVPQNIRSRATLPSRVGVRSLYRLLVLALHAIPLLSWRFTHVSPSLYVYPPFPAQWPSLTSILEVASNPSPESLLQCFRLRVLETRGNFIPPVSLAQHFENFTDILAMILLDPAFDEFDQ